MHLQIVTTPTPTHRALRRRRHGPHAVPRAPQPRRSPILSRRELRRIVAEMLG